MSQDSSTKESKKQLPESSKETQNKPIGKKSIDVAPKYSDIPIRSEFETFSGKFSRKVQENPLVPLGLVVTIGALTAGLYSLVSGKRELSQRMMRLRVLAQGFTVFALMGGVWYQGSKALPGDDGDNKP